jgi:hypothetical protein
MRRPQSPRPAHEYPAYNSMSRFTRSISAFPWKMKSIGQSTLQRPTRSLSKS